MVTLTFIATSMLVLITPGPTNTVLAASGARLGMRRAANLPFAEAIGYIVAISFFVLFAELMRDNQTALAVVRLAAAAWLSYSAYRLWQIPFEADPAARDSPFRRVLLTTIVNPKAMLIGTILIPVGSGADAPAWIITFAALSTFAGFGWVALGALLPLGIRRHAHKLAAVVLSGFSVVAIASVATA
jgi:threonine/homoserine/homoserine lactone efflux protein